MGFKNWQLAGAQLKTEKQKLWFKKQRRQFPYIFCIIYPRIKKHFLVQIGREYFHYSEG